VKLFGGQVTPSFLNLLKLLADRQRIAVLDAVLERFLTLYREQRGIALAAVTSATPLSEEQQEALHRKVKAVAGTDNVEFDLTVDPSLLGGFVVSLGSQVIDASLAGQVRRLGLALAKAV
jgi:F-type H+-transporting ATPase subunit delta